MLRELTRSMVINGRMLGLFALVTALLLSGTHLVTKDKIAESQRRAAQKALLEIIPKDLHDNDLLTDTLPIPPQYWSTLGLNDGGELHLARHKGELIAVVIPGVAPDGYSGDIDIITGINIDNTIAGVRVLKHSETPGLGDKIELKKSPWILDFKGKSLDTPKPERWKVKKDKGDFDQFSGATITPRAVVGQVLRTLTYYAEDKARIIKASHIEQPKVDPVKVEPVKESTTLEPSVETAASTAPSTTLLTTVADDTTHHVAGETP